MIRVRKNITAPKSLSTTKKYDGEDVLRQLEEDHYKKCYLCERHLTTDFEVEHLLSRENYSDLEQNWKNLFWSCGYCNRKKSDKFDDILNPVNEPGPSATAMASKSFKSIPSIETISSTIGSNVCE